MHVDASRSSIVVKNLSLFCDLELIIGLHAILLLLDSMHTFIKLTQSCDVFVRDFIDIMKVCWLDLYHFYFNPYTKFDDLAFDELKVLESFISKNLLISWCEDLNGKKADCLIIKFAGVKLFVNQRCLAIGALKLVLMPYFLLVIVHVKSSCEDYTRALLHELGIRFSNHERMSTLGVIYLNFWARNS